MNYYAKSTLERMNRKELIEYSLMLQNECKKYEETIDIQYTNASNLIDKMEKTIAQLSKKEMEVK